MWRAPSRLRGVLRNRHVSRFPIPFVLLLTACARLVGLESSDEKSERGLPSPPSAGASSDGTPVDGALLPGPPTECGDVTASPDNCGFCGHACRGDACVGGLCAEQVVTRSAKLDAFVTDGVDLFVIDDGTPMACPVPGPSTQTCRPLIAPDEVTPRVTQALASEPPDGNGTRVITVNTGPLAAKAIALRDQRVLFADDTYHAVLACPKQGDCNRSNVGVVIVRGDSPPDPKPFGKTLAVGAGPAGLICMQESTLFAGPLPPDGKDAKALPFRKDTDTAKIARIVASDGVFWLSALGLHRATALDRDPERWFAGSATDFAVDQRSVYLATKGGLLRLVRADQSQTIAAAGEFVHVAVDARGVFATQPIDGGSRVVEVRAQTLLELAVVPGGIDSLAVAGDYVYYAVKLKDRMELRRISR